MRVLKIHDDGHCDVELEDSEIEEMLRAARAAGVTPERWFSDRLRAELERMGAPAGDPIQVLDLLDR